MANDPQSLRTARARIAGLGSAHAGTGHFWLQRITALANAVLVVAFLVLVIAASGRPHAEASAIVAHPLAAIAMLLFTVSVALHMRVGMQVIIEDYVHGEFARIVAVVANTFFAAAVAAASIFAILKLGFGRIL